MNSITITQAFQGKKAFVAFVTGGDPDIATTEKLVLALAEAGADIIEIGVPFSDPVAEGPVIQAADERALAGGCTVDKLFDMVKGLRGRLSVPLLLMTYVNPVFVYGAARFMQNCAACGVSGIIVPDLPFEERDELAAVCRAHGVTQIAMAAPTSEARVAAIAREAEGFLYCVSSLGVTGARGDIDPRAAADMVRRVRQVSAVPCAVGFGISTPEQARAMSAVADGVIVGSALVALVAEHGAESVQPVKAFAREIKTAMGGG